jgi:hypothetical protein
MFWAVIEGTALSKERESMEKELVKVRSHVRSEKHFTLAGESI